MKRIPSLDGLRALSIVLVVLLHTAQSVGMTHPLPWFVFALANGGLGVTIFFVISGYLITSLLLAEHEKAGRISFKNFYLRRIYRIFPPLYTYVGFLLVLSALGLLALSGIDLASALLLFRNYSYGASSWALEHMWSLSVEEQFYLLWPFLLVGCLRRHTDFAAGKAAAAKIALGVIVASPFIRVAFRVLAPHYASPYMFHMLADPLMFGCVAALLQGSGRFERFYEAGTRIWWLPPAVLFLVSGALGIRFGNSWNFPIGTSLNGLCIMLFLLWSVRNPGSALGRVFNHRVVAHIGVLSYSIYIWQTFFLHHRNVEVFGGHTFFNTWPGSWLCILAVSELSFYGVERPFMGIRKRLERRAFERAAPQAGDAAS